MAKKTNKMKASNLKNMYQICSNGLTTGTRILDPSGKQVGKVVKAVWEANINSPLTKLTLTISGSTIDAEASDVTMKRDIKKTMRSR